MHGSCALAIAAALAFALARAGGMQLEPQRERDDVVFLAGVEVRHAAAVHDSAGSDVARAGGHRSQPTKLTRTLRLTGAVAYNAFKTTPVITQVGGPVSRILVVPGQHVREGQPMLEVTSPDYSQLLDTYLKARDTFRVADKNYDRAKDLYEHNAIAERDLLQAESDRNQAQADLNASEQAMKILGIKNPEDLAKAPSSRADSRARADRAAKWSSGSSRRGR